MSSRDGPRAAGSDGTDFQHRERIAGRYQTSAANKSRLRNVIYLHLLLSLLMLLRLTPSLLLLASIPPPSWLSLLSLPPPYLWEHAWLASAMPCFLGLVALKRNRAFLLKQYALGIIVFGVAPVAYGIWSMFGDLVNYWATRETTKLFLGFPVVVLWNMFLFIALQLHAVTLLLSWSLVGAWAPKKKAE